MHPDRFISICTLTAQNSMQHATVTVSHQCWNWSFRSPGQ